MGFKSKTAEKVEFVEPGQVVTGRITNVQKVESLGINAYTMVDEDGKLIKVLGTTVIDPILQNEEGSLVRITYKGESKTGGGFKVKLFDVEVWEDEDDGSEAIANATTKSK